MEQYPVKPGTPVLQVYNKADLVSLEDIPAGQDVVAISAKRGMGMENLLKAIRFETPDYIPMTFHSNAACWNHDDQNALLDLKAAHDSYQMVDAYVIGQGGADWSSLLTIDRGSNSGIEVGMCAITAHGQVVGLVTEVGPNYAVVKTVLDSSLEISATISSSGYNGMVQGGYTTGYVGMLRMDYLPTEAVIRNRDEVVTAGSTMYPRDLLLGYVVDAAFDDTGVAKYAILEPATDFGSLKQLFILTSYGAG